MERAKQAIISDYRRRPQDATVPQFVDWFETSSAMEYQKP